LKIQGEKKRAAATGAASRLDADQLNRKLRRRQWRPGRVNERSNRSSRSWAFLFFLFSSPNSFFFLFLFFWSSLIFKPVEFLLSAVSRGGSNTNDERHRRADGRVMCGVVVGGGGGVDLRPGNGLSFAVVVCCIAAAAAAG